MTYTLVYPASANISEGKISVLAPIGGALLGRKVGDTIEQKVPQGKLTLKIERILSKSD
jgi:transcription elongation GreA/GreB family factor